MNTPHENPPICEECNCHISIKHILIDCPKYSRYRGVFKNQLLENILAENKDFSFYNILTFLKQTNLLNKL